MTNRGALAGEKQAPSFVPPGVIWEYAGATLPDPQTWGIWLWADNSLVSRSQYPDLFKAVGFAHSPTPGTDPGNNQFYLPNKVGRMGVGYDVSQTEFNTLGKVGGSKTSTSPHTHTLTSGGPSNNTSTGQSVDHNHGNTGGISANHTHTVNAHAHGGGTGVHAHVCLNNIYVNGTPAHGHDGAGDQSSERPNVTSGFSSPGNNTNSVGQGNTSESPGTGTVSSDHVHGTGGVNTGHTHDLQSHTHSGTSADSSATAASGNLPPYATMTYIVKA